MCAQHTSTGHKHPPLVCHAAVQLAWSSDTPLTIFSWTVHPSNESQSKLGMKKVVTPEPCFNNFSKADNIRNSSCLGLPLTNLHLPESVLSKWLNRDAYIIYLNIATCKWWFPFVLLEKACHVSTGCKMHRSFKKPWILGLYCSFQGKWNTGATLKVQTPLERNVSNNGTPKQHAEASWQMRQLR